MKLYGSSIKKSYELIYAYDHVLEVNRGIKHCYDVEQMVISFVKDGARPNWYLNLILRNFEELGFIKALICITKALVWLYERTIMDRDIWWLHVGYFKDIWLFLDIDKACPKLCFENHEFEMNTKKHNCSVDIWRLNF